MEEYLVGVDVGTGSVRAALVTKSGKIIEVSTAPITTWTPKPGYFEQSSTDIWNKCCKVVKAVTQNVDPKQIRGIGFDATCSLVVIDEQGQPLTVSETRKNEQNVILWLDHRAHKEAEFINKLQHTVLKYIGGKISLEMETPKLLWLKKNMKDSWDKAGLFFDLPDFLTWKATGAESRSLCSLVCKWTYEAGPGDCKGWNLDYFKQIGLEDLQNNNWKKIGSLVEAPGSPCGQGLTAKAAAETGLLPGTPVATSIIDAHAGGLGMIGCSAPNVPTEFKSRIGLICGTSTCHMAVHQDAQFIAGVWGPYYSAMVPGLWLNEGGQSATGKLVDHIIETHPAYAAIKMNLRDRHIQQYLNDLLELLAKKEKLSSVSLLTKKIHIWPDFHGNRSPLADPTLSGMVSGLSLSADEENLAVLYLATIQALCYGTLHILNTLRKNGYSDVKAILVCGGLSSNPLFVQTQADVIGLPVLVPLEKESVLLGSAILAACASRLYPNVKEAVCTMGGQAHVLQPREDEHRYHQMKYKVFLKMVEDQKSYEKLMSSL